MAAAFVRQVQSSTEVSQLVNDHPARLRGLRPGDLYPTHDGMLLLLLQADLQAVERGTRLLLRKADAKC